MKKIALSLALIAVAFTSLAAQSAAPITAEGSKALVFSFNGFGTFGLGGIPASKTLVGAGLVAETYGAGATLFVADKAALRGAFNLSYASDGTNSEFLLALRPEYLWYLGATGPVALYAGAYAELGVGTGLFEFGAGGELGVEYFFVPRLSVSAAYSLGFTMIQQDPAEFTGFGVGMAGAFLSVYF